MQASPGSLAQLADRFLVAYACTSSVEASVAALFNVGHAAELYLKAVMCAIDPSCDVLGYNHELGKLLNDVQAKDARLLRGYLLRQRAADRYLLNVDLPANAKHDPDYDHFNEHRELYWVSRYLADTKYLFAAHKKLHGKSFSIMIVGLNEYWQPFFKELRDFLRSQGVSLSPSLLKAAASPNMSALPQTYLKALA